MTKGFHLRTGEPYLRVEKPLIKLFLTMNHAEYIVFGYIAQRFMLSRLNQLLELTYEGFSDYSHSKYSTSSFQRGIAGLIDKKLIERTHLQNIYKINKTLLKRGFELNEIIICENDTSIKNML